MSRSRNEMLTSPHNPLLKEIRKAVQRGSLTASGHAVAENFHLLSEALQSGLKVESVVAASSVAPRVEAVLPNNVPLVLVDDSTFKTVATTETSQGVLALVEPPQWTLGQVFGEESVTSLVVVLDRIQEPGNAGAIVRAAEAFGATGVLSVTGTANAYNPKFLRASAGSVFRLPLIASLGYSELIQLLDQHRTRIFTLDAHGTTPVHDADLTTSSAIIIGNEGGGVAEELLERSERLRIPVQLVESLNAAVAAGVALYEARRQRESRR
ncbi:MAG TPA: RNA methyltransferase [Bryobacteraceae bacterium]|nr:RNA methyltransferase [Bryobacteraceae bacterium]